MSAGPATLDRIRRHLVGLKMPRSLEVLEHLLRQLERGEISALEAIDSLLDEELSLRENRRVKAALKMGRLLNVKTLAGFDFAFQPSLDRNRILTLAELDFINRHEVVHFLGQPDPAPLYPPRYVIENPALLGPELLLPGVLTARAGRVSRAEPPEWPRAPLCKPDAR
jgi:hypothetical protein